MLTRDEIIWGYRFMLDRDPRLDELSCLMLDPVTQTQFRTRLLTSSEFAENEKVIGHVTKWVIAEIFGGAMKIWIDLADKYVSYGCLLDCYEWRETTVFRRLLQPGFHVVDVGANVGWFTFLAALCVGPDGRVTSVEPRVPTVDYLRRSVCLNHLGDRINVLQNAVGNRCGPVSLIWHPASRNPGNTYLGEPGENSEGQIAEMRELDTLLGKARVDFIKMDIEGAEGLALAGARMVLQQNHPFILCELNPGALRKVSNISVDELLRLVRDQGYIAFSIDDHAELARLEGSPEFGNLELINVVLAHEARLPDAALS